MEAWFAKKLIRWYEGNKRDLPWRQVSDPYKIWLSEVILQQTQVAQGLSYYLKFTDKYPTVCHLAKASEDEVLRLWQGLGYYSRARNLHFAAKTIHLEYKGLFPKDFEGIRSLKGVGDYTAAAIASFAFDLPHAVVDGNVYRVLSRVFGIKDPIDNHASKKMFQDLADQLLDKKNPAIYNQAIMEFGSQYCKPANPDCENCIFIENCLAFKNKLVSELPIKAKKTKIRERYFNYLILLDKKGKLKISRRAGGDIWQGLYEFDLIETKGQLSQEKLLRSKEFKALVNTDYGIEFVSKQYKHVLSHQVLHAKFYVIRMHSFSGKKTTQKKDALQSMIIDIDKLQDFAFPRLIGKFMDDCNLEEII